MWDGLGSHGLAMLTGDGPERQAIADAMHAAWIAFGRTGDPGWPAYEAGQRRTLIVDETDRVEADPRAERRRAWAGFTDYR